VKYIFSFQPPLMIFIHWEHCKETKPALSKVNVTDQQLLAKQDLINVKQCHVWALKLSSHMGSVKGRVAAQPQN